MTDNHTGVDTSQEAVEMLAANLARAKGSVVLPSVYLGDRDAEFLAVKAAATLRALSAELTEARAATKSAYEKAAHWIESVPMSLPYRQEYACHIRALATESDSTALAGEGGR